MIVLSCIRVCNDWVIYRDGHKCWQFIPLDISFKTCDGPPVCNSKHYVLLVSILNIGIEFTWEKIEDEEDGVDPDCGAGGFV